MDTPLLQTAPLGFVAATPQGALRLRIDAAPVRHAADAAIALQRCAGLLDALDAWAATALDWRWATSHPSSADAAVTVAWQPQAATLALPWAWLRSVAPPPEALARQLRWPQVPAILTLAWLPLDVEALRLLEPGGAVVLPASLQRPWRGVLRASDEAADAAAGIALDLEAPCAPRVLGAAAAAEVGAPPHDACEVRLEPRGGIDVEPLAGWRDGLLGEIGSSASLWRRVGPQRGEQRLASGRLMRWGDGWALALEAVDEGALAA